MAAQTQTMNPPQSGQSAGHNPARNPQAFARARAEAPAAERQAVMATLCVFTVTLLLYLTGIIRVTSRLALGVAIGLGGR